MRLSCRPARAVDLPCRIARHALAAASVTVLLGLPAVAQNGGWGPPTGWQSGPGWGPPQGGGWGWQGPWPGGPGGFSGGPGYETRGEPALIDVIGIGKARVAPDLAVVTVGVSVQSPTASDAMSQNAARQRAVIDALNGAGISPRDIQTTNLNLTAVQDYSREGQPPLVTGYQASNGVTVRVHDLPRLGAILDALVAAGANEVQNIVFTRDDDDASAAEARRMAVADARTKAEVIAGAAGQRLGRLVTLSETGNVARPAPVVRMRAMEADAAGPTPVEAGEVNISARVTATWELVPIAAGPGSEGLGSGGPGSGGPGSGGPGAGSPSRGGDMPAVDQGGGVSPDTSGAPWPPVATPSDASAPPSADAPAPAAPGTVAPPAPAPDGSVAPAPLPAPSN